MKSIRLSLIVYFLALMAVGLGAVCALFFFTTAQTLEAKEESTRQLYVRRFETQRDETLADIDKQLLQQTRLLAARARSSNVSHEHLLPLGLVGLPTIPQAHLNLPLWLAEGMEKRLPFEIYRARSPIIYLVARNDPFEEEPPDPQYYQMVTADGRLRESSPSLGEYRFGLDDEIRRSDLFTERIDTVLIEGKKVRRVTFKSAIFKSRFVWFPRPSKGKAFPPPKDTAAPIYYLIGANSLDEFDHQVAGFERELSQKIANLEQETEDALGNLRSRLAWIGLAVFCGLALGGFGLLCLGLRPLRRLSDAVSQVSERDFKLRVRGGSLPVELQPIAGRLKQTLDLLQKAFAREKQASADISHELRTPLAALLTTLEVALRKNRSAEEYREILEECRGSGQQMYQLVERLLALARLDAGAVQLKPQQVDVGRLAQQCANLVKPLVEERGLTLRVQAPEAVTVQADPDKVREVLTNLLHNAIEYNKPAGSIELLVERSNGHVELAVRDTGIGISAEEREHIFERFYRADPSRQADTPHAGLGLSIVKSYVDLMGGSIAVESSDAGSTFIVALPCGA